MRKAKQEFYIYHIVDAIAGNLYRMAPRNRPRNMDKIMSHVIERAEQACVDVVNNRHLFMTTEEFNEWLTNTLKSCPEFCDLNLSQNEYEKHISVDDESRPKFAFTSAYDAETENSWRYDFIDLDAAIRNIYNCIIAAHDETNCFLCDHKDDNETCLHCRTNYNAYKNYYECANKPHDPTKYAGWCSTGCPEGIAVCCKDCTKKNSCTLDVKCEDFDLGCPWYVVNPNF